MTDPKVASQNEKPVSSNISHNFLTIGPDMVFAKQIQTCLNTLKTAGSTVDYKIFPAVDLPKAIEFLAKHPMHSILVQEEACSSEGPSAFYKKLKDILAKIPDNVAAPIVMVAGTCDLEKTKYFVESGFVDVLLKPLDNNLFLQKMHSYNPKIKILSESTLFTMAVNHEIEVALTLKSRTMSEYEIVISSDRSFALGEILTLRGKYFPHGQIAIVKEVKPGVKDAAGKSGPSAVRLLFVGIHPDQTQFIRKLIREDYIAAKGAA